MKFTTSLVVLTTSLTITLPALAFDLKHQDATLHLSSTPEKVVSFDLAHLDTLNTLGISVAGVPKSVYFGPLEKYNDVTVVGTLFEPDYAQLQALGPELIIAGGRSASAVPKLNDVAPTVTFASDSFDFLGSVKDSSIAIGKAWGKEEQSKAAFAGIEKNVNELHKINKGKKGVLLFVIKGNVIAHAPGDRFGYMHEITGLEPVLPTRDKKEAAAPRPKAGSPEAKAAAAKRAQELTDVVKADPDWLIVLDRGAINNGEKTADKTLAGHPQLSQTSAFKNGRIYYVDPNSWYVMGGGLGNLKSITDRMITAMKDGTI